MAGLEGLRVGNAAAVSREALIARLERTAAAGVFQWEGNRRARVVEDLARRQLAAQHVRIPGAADVRERLLRGRRRPTPNGAERVLQLAGHRPHDRVLQLSWAGVPNAH